MYDMEDQSYVYALGDPEWPEDLVRETFEGKADDSTLEEATQMLNSSSAEWVRKGLY